MGWKPIRPRKHVDEERFETRVDIGPEQPQMRLVVSGTSRYGWLAAAYAPKQSEAAWVGNERFKDVDLAKAACEKWAEDQKLLEGQDPKSPIDSRTLRRIRELGGQWAAYRNEDMSSGNFGHLKFLKFGSGCTYTEPPKPKLPDTPTEINWRYYFAGIVDVRTGLVTEENKNEGDVAERVECKLCRKQVLAKTAHRHDGGYIGDACCWDERLKSTE